MNYLAEILAFNNWIRYNSGISKSDICLWHGLMSMANRFSWREFNAPILTLLSESKLTKNEFYKSRNKLKQFGLIEFKEKKGNQCTVYKINSCVSLFGTHFGTQFETESGTTFDTPFNTVSETPIDTNVGNTNKTKNINKNINRNKKEIIKEKFGEFENVFLSADELQKLKSKLGVETESYIERLSSYIASSGKKYKSHYATILSWTQKDTKSFGGVDHGRSDRKLCTEYPE